MGQKESSNTDDSTEVKKERRGSSVGNYFTKKREKWERNFLLKNIQKVQDSNIPEEEKIQQQKNLINEAQGLIDEQIFQVIVSINPILLQFGINFQNNMEIVKIALKKDWKSYAYINEKLKSSPELRKLFILSQISQNHTSKKDLIENLDILDIDLLNLYIKNKLEPLITDEFESIFKFHESTQILNDMIDWSIKNYFKEFTEYCLKTKRLQFKDQETILHLICRKGSIELCEKALDLYPELKNQRNIHQKTCFNIAKTHQWKKLMKVLKDKYQAELGPCLFINLKFEFVSYILTFSTQEDLNVLKDTSKIFRASLNLEYFWRRKCAVELDYFGQLFRESWSVTYFVLENCKNIRDLNIKNIHFISSFENKVTEKPKDLLTFSLVYDIQKNQKDVNPMSYNETVYDLEWVEIPLKSTVEILMKQENGKLFLSCFTNNRNDLYVNKNKTESRLISRIHQNPVIAYLGKNKQIENQYVVKIVSTDFTGYFSFFEDPPQENQKFLEIQNLNSEFHTFSLSLNPPQCHIGATFSFNVYYKGRIDIEILNVNLDVLYKQKKLGNIEFQNIGTVKSLGLSEFVIPVEFKPKSVSEEALIPLIDDYYDNGSVIFDFQGFIIVKVLITQFKYPIQFTQEKKF